MYIYMYLYICIYVYIYMMQPPRSPPNGYGYTGGGRVRNRFFSRGGGVPRKVLLCNNADAGKVDRQEATGAARVRGGACGDYYFLAKHSAMHWFGKQKQLHAGDRWGGGRGVELLLLFFVGWVAEDHYDYC